MGFSDFWYIEKAEKIKEYYELIDFYLGTEIPNCVSAYIVLDINACGACNADLDQEEIKQIKEKINIAFVAYMRKHVEHEWNKVMINSKSCFATVKENGEKKQGKSDYKLPRNWRAKQNGMIDNLCVGAKDKVQQAS